MQPTHYANSRASRMWASGMCGLLRGDIVSCDTLPRGLSAARHARRNQPCWRVMRYVAARTVRSPACAAQSAVLSRHAIHCHTNCPQPGTRGEISRAGVSCDTLPRELSAARRARRNQPCCRGMRYIAARTVRSPTRAAQSAVLSRHAIHCRADCPQPGARGAISRAAAACCIVPLQTGDMRRESNVAGGHGSCAPLCGMPGVAGMAGLTRSCAAWKLICLSQRRILQQFLARVDAQLVIYVLVVVLYSVLIYV
jgi:hypothetical protein